MRTTKLVPAVALLVAALAAGASHQPKYVHPDDMNWAALLKGPPPDNSAEHKAEVEAILDWQKKRTPEDVARCKAEVPANAFYFSKVLGSWFNQKSLPITADLMNQAFIDANGVSEHVKQHWNRVRPWLADSRIHPVSNEKSTSYPSGHAVRGIVWATVLAEMFPEHNEELMAVGKQFGDDRVVGGMHYTSDVTAGQKLGEEIAKKLLANTDFRNAMERAKEECLAAAHR